MDNWQTPVTILAWFVIVCIAVPMVIVLGVGVATLYKDGSEIRKQRRADKGKLTCEAPTCKDVASYQTPNGYYCIDHSTVSDYISRVTTYATVSWRRPLRHMKG